VRDAGGNTPLHYSAKAGKLAICQLLLSCGVDPNTKNKSGETPLHFALKRVFIFCGGKIVEKFCGGKIVEEFISIAEKDTLAICQLLLSYGADPNAAAYRNETPLHHSVQNGYLNICELLLTKGARPNVKGTTKHQGLMLLRQNG
jgi:ankyrin repeat protein